MYKNYYRFLPNSSRKKKKNTEEEKTLANYSFYVICITIVPKPYNDIPSKENYKSISLMNANYQWKLENRIQQDIKRSTEEDQIGLIPGTEFCFKIQILINGIYINSINKDNNHR